MKWFTSDWHLSHKNIIRFSDRPFDDLEKMDDKIISNMLDVIKPGDEIFNLGDISWGQEAMWKMFNQLPDRVQFHWILGNHDKGFEKFRERCTSISLIKETKIQGHPVTMCHYPMVSWNKSHYNAWMLFGHHHVGTENSPDLLTNKTRGKMLNVNVEFHDFKMWSENEIVEIMGKKPDNWNFHRK